MPTPKSIRGYKTKRKYTCPYCDEKLMRGDLVDHIDQFHQVMIPQDYTAARVVYDHINGKNYGTCFICGCKVYEWDSRLWRYKNLCDKKSCRDAVHNKAMNNHLDDPEKQKQMLANRKISGTYTFTDGGKKSYVGSYERKALEFMDKVLNIPSKDIETPGPTCIYKYMGEEHPWITDIFYIPAMLVIDVKDGGDNPNNRPMEGYREKQIAKEAAIVEEGKYNYLRLTNNNFAQLMSAIADIRYGEVVNDPKKGIYIHESSINEAIVGGIPPKHAHNDYIVPIGMQGMNGKSKFVFGNSMFDKVFTFDDDDEVVIAESVEELLEIMQGIDGKVLTATSNNPSGKGRVGNKRFRKIKFKGIASPKIKKGALLKAKQAVKSGKAKSMHEYFLEELLGKPYTSDLDIYMNPNVVCEVDEVYPIDESIIKIREYLMTEEFIESRGEYLNLYKDAEGFYLAPKMHNFKFTSDYYQNYTDIPQFVEDFMNIICAKRWYGEE